MLIILALSIISRVLSAVSSIPGTSTSIALNPGKFSRYEADKTFAEEVTLFSDQLTLEMYTGHQVSDIHGRFVYNPRNSATSRHLDAALLQDCADLNYYMVEKDEPGQVNRAIQNFVKKFKTFLRKFSEEPSKIKNTLSHFQCSNAIKLCKPADFGVAYFTKLLTDYPHIFKDHLDLFEHLDDFSFLTVESAKILYGEMNYLMNPFSLEQLVQTVKVEVIVTLLEMWGYDLRIGDAKTVISIWGEEEDFLQRVEKDPRSWLLWRKSGQFISFPMDLLLENLTLESVEKHLKLIFAWMIDNEYLITSALCKLESLYADLHKNDPLEKKYMTPEMSAQLDSRKLELWREAGKVHFDSISQQMAIKKRLIDKMEYLTKASVPEARENNLSSHHLTIFELSVILQIPLNLLTRDSFNKSHDPEATFNFSFESPDYTPAVRPEMLLNLNFWAFMWKQLKEMGIEAQYNETTSKYYTDYNMVLQTLILSIHRFGLQSNRSKSYYWFIQVALMTIPNLSNDLEKSEQYMEKLLAMAGEYPFELTKEQIQILQIALHPETVSKYSRYFNNDRINFIIDAFNLAPEVLRRDEIVELIRSEELKSMVKLNYANALGLRTLADFTVEDLLEFFPIDADYHLEHHEAFYTINPEILTGYLKACGGAVNHPEKYIWWVHPRCWKDLKFVDAVSELITFDMIMRNPRDSDIINLPYILTDIMGRISRLDASESVQKVIIKWIVQVEWFHIQFFNMFCMDREKLDGLVAQQYDKLSIMITRSRAELITWLKSNNTLEDRDEILELLERIPASYMRASVAYEKFLFKTVEKIKNPNARRIQLDSMAVYTFFDNKTAHQIKLQEIEAEVQVAVEKCQRMIEKYLDGRIEKQIWAYRLKFANIPTVLKYPAHPIRTQFVEILFHGHKAPIHDLQVVFAMFSRQGLGYASCYGTDEEFLPISANFAELTEQRAKHYEDYLEGLRKFILIDELRKLRLLKK